MTSPLTVPGRYYTGILILTTNRLSTIDPAMKSRIHVSLCYEPLNNETRARLWRAFLERAGVQDEGKELDGKLMDNLSRRPLTGQSGGIDLQIAIAVRKHQIELRSGGADDAVTTVAFPPL